MTTKKRSILLSVMTLMLCLALVAGGTYALFSDDVKLKNHLVAGQMNVELYRTDLEQTYLDPDTGFLKYYNEPDDADDIDFSNPSEKSVFEIPKGTLIVPGCEYIATMEIRNNETKSDVAFGYWIEVVLNAPVDDATGDKIIAELAKQITVTVTKEGETKGISKRLSEGLEVRSDNNDGFIGILDQKDNKVDEFKVGIKFENLSNNNDAMRNTVDFDIFVHAVQVTEKPANP